MSINWNKQVSDEERKHAYNNLVNNPDFLVFLEILDEYRDAAVNSIGDKEVHEHGAMSRAAGRIELLTDIVEDIRRYETF